MTGRSERELWLPAARLLSPFSLLAVAVIGHGGMNEKTEPDIPSGAYSLRVQGPNDRALGPENH